MSRPALRGDEADLYREFAARLRRRIASDVAASPEVVDDACAFAWERLLVCQPDRGHVHGWLTVTARHEAWRLSALELRDIRGRDMGDVRGASQDARLILADLSAALSPRQRTFVGLQAAGHKRSEIAALSGASVRTVDRQLRRARERLRRIP